MDPPPPGFELIREYRRRSFRGQAFALHAASIHDAELFLGDDLALACGILIATWDRPTEVVRATARLHHLRVPDVALASLPAIVELMLDMLERLSRDEDREQSTRLELDRSTADQHRMALEFDGIRTGLTREIAERRATEAKLRESERRTRALMDLAFEFVGLLTPEGRLLEANGTALRLVGQTLDDLREMPFWETPWWRHSPELQEKLKVAIARAAEGEVSRFEATHVDLDGRVHTVDFSMKPARDDDGRVEFLIPEGWDITDRKHAEEEIRTLNRELETRVAERTAMLEVANKELEAFAYSVSHDLRAPLRHVAGFIDLLQQHLGPNLDPEALRYCAIIANAAHGMGNMIDDLLSFSRMGRVDLVRTAVDLGALTREVLGELGPECAGRTIVWKVGDLPTVTADRHMLRLALANVFSNAVKFTRTRPTAEIEIGCSVPPGSDEVVLFVRDNGVGFDTRYVDKLFKVFQRLHRAEDFEGTGVGLASVRRIVERHGGRTWAEGAPGEGATFFLSLPTAC